MVRMNCTTLAIVLLVLPVSGYAALSPTQLCESSMENASAKFAQCRLKTEVIFTKKGDITKYNAALGKCATNLQTSFAKAVSKYGLACPATEPASAFQSYLTSCADATASAASGGTFPLPGGAARLPATGQITCYDADGFSVACAGTGHDGEIRAGATLAYTDNGDGTITDQNTGLTWEKLTDDGSIHDWENTYSWEDAFQGKIAVLNSAGGFAGHTDWRVPNIRELQSLLHYGNAFPTAAIAPIFRTNCIPGCDGISCACTSNTVYYLTSTTDRNIPDAFWAVEFGYGVPTSLLKYDGAYLRAVRGGL